MEPAGYERLSKLDETFLSFETPTTYMHVALTGPSKGDLRDFLSRTVATDLPQRYPALKPLAARIATAEPSFRDVEGGVELRIEGRLPWTDLRDVLEGLL